MSTAAFAVAIIVIIFVATVGLAGVLLIGMGLRAEDGKEAEE